MNVHNHLKHLSAEKIKEIYQQAAIDSAIGMTHISGDFNFGSLIRSANFFGFKEVFYIGGRRHYDRRSTVGTHHYIPVTFFKSEEEFLEFIFSKNYTLICVENNLNPSYQEKAHSIFDPNVFTDSNRPLFLFGEEQMGISTFFLEKCQKIITIPAFGTVRSINVGSCSAIIMAIYRNQYNTVVSSLSSNQK